MSEAVLVSDDVGARDDVHRLVAADPEKKS